MIGLILSFLFYNIIVFLIYRHYRRGEYKIPISQLILFTLLFIAFGTYGNHLGDYWRINEMVDFFGKSSIDVEEGFAMEKHYYLLAKLVNGNYILWRLIINCVAFIGFAFFLGRAFGEMLNLQVKLILCHRTSTIANVFVESTTQLIF